MEQALQGLMNLGLKRKEAQVYLAALQLGRGSAQSIAQKAGLKRPTTYIILAELMQKGLVLKVPKARGQMFVAKPPKELYANAEERIAQARAALPALEAIAKAQEKVRTLYFEGTQGVREALFFRFDELKGQPIRAFFGDSQGATPELNSLFHEWNEATFKNGNTITSIVPNSTFLKQFRAKDMEYGFTPKVVSPKHYTSKCSIDITSLFIRVVLFKEQQAIIIESNDAAKAFTEIFEMVYQKY